MKAVLRTRGCCVCVRVWVCVCVGGWWRKSRLICYVFKARTQEEFYASNGETCVLYCGDGRGQRGGDGKMP